MCIKDGFYGLNTSKMAKNTRKIGDIGERIACEYLVRKGFVVISRNYRKSWGEIDIIANKDSLIHFVEVKSAHTYFSFNDDSHHPEENVDGWKMKQIRKMIQTYFDENGKGLENQFCFHVICVYLDMVKRKAKVRMIENIIL